METLNTFFGGVCELDLLHSIDKVHFILDEMIMNGEIANTNADMVLENVRLLGNYDDDDFTTEMLGQIFR